MRSRARVSVVIVCLDEKKQKNCNYNLKNNRDYLCQKGKVVTQYFTLSLKCQVVAQKCSLSWNSSKALKLHTRLDIPGETILIVHLLSKHSSIMFSGSAINTTSLIHVFFQQNLSFIIFQSMIFVRPLLVISKHSSASFEPVHQELFYEYFIRLCTYFVKEV